MIETVKNPCNESSVLDTTELTHKQQLETLEKKLKIGHKIVLADDAEAMWLPMDQIDSKFRNNDVRSGGYFIKQGGIEKLDDSKYNFQISRISHQLGRIGVVLYFPEVNAGIPSGGVYSRCIDIEATYRINGWAMETPMKTSVSKEQTINESLNQIKDGESIETHRATAEITVGERPNGDAIFGRSIKSTIEVQHLSNKAIIGC